MLGLTDYRLRKPWPRFTRVAKGWHPVNPRQLWQYFETKKPDLHLAIANLLNVEVIRDIYYVRGWRGPKKGSNLVVELLVAWLYRNDLHLGDITFVDPDKPIPEANRRFELQTHEGLGLLPILMANMKSKGKQLRCEQLTLTAAMLDQVGLFKRFGFVVEDSDNTRQAMKLGVGIPMEQDI